MNRTTEMMVGAIAASAGFGQAAEITEPPSRRWGPQTPVRTGGDPGRLTFPGKTNENKSKQKAQRKARKASRRR